MVQSSGKVVNEITFNLKPLKMRFIFTLNQQKITIAILFLFGWSVYVSDITREILYCVGLQGS